MSALPPAIAAAFAAQAGFCRQFAAPFTGAMVAAAAAAVDDSSAMGRRLIAWPGDPHADALMMRVTGAFHALVRAGRAPALAPLYPPAPCPEPAVLVAAIRAVLADPESDAFLAAWLDSPPQTNEVARSGVLMPGLMVIADACRLPLRLFELGASAGLNLCLDRFGYRLGGVAAGDPASPVQLAPGWRGPPPPVADVVIASRAGIDISPLDVRNAATRERLLAFVWPDQPERLARAEAAIALAAADPPPLYGGDAADLVDAMVPLPGSVGVVFHSIAFQYFPPATQARIAARLAAFGAQASAQAPLAWLRYEVDDASVAALPTLRLTLWRGGALDERLLARAHPHGSFVQWL